MKASLMAIIFLVIAILNSSLQTTTYADPTRLEQYVAGSDRIVTGIVTDKEMFGDTEEVWIGVYEWLKDGNNGEQIILDMNHTSPDSEIDFDIGEEVLLMLKDKDVVNGHYRVYRFDSGPAMKYPISMREEVVSLVKQLSENKTQVQKEGEELQKLLANSDTENCKISEFDGDRFLYCTYQDEEMKFYVPISMTLEHVRQELLKHTSEEYFNEHFNLKRAWDEAVVNGHAVPVGQTMEFEYTIGNFTLHYLVHVRLGFEEADRHLLYLQYVPPREVTDIAIQDEGQIEKLIYSSSCLPAGTPYELGDRVALAHVDRGFSPLINGRGPPDVFDRYGNQVQQAEKRFKIWLETGEIQCTSSVRYDDVIDASIGRGQKVVLMDASSYLNSGTDFVIIENSLLSAVQFLPTVATGAAIAGIIAFLTLRRVKSSKR